MLRQVQFLFCAILISGGLMLHADFPIKVMFYPSVTRDDSVNRIFNDRISALGVYFFRSGKEIPRLSDYTFTIELPESIRIHSAVPIDGWVPQKKHYRFAASPSKRSGYIVYHLPLPKHNLTTRFQLDAAVGFTGFHVLYWIEPSGKGKVPAEFESRWSMAGNGKSMDRTQKFRTEAFHPARRFPENFKLWAESGSVNMDSEEIQQQIKLFQGMGIRHIECNNSNPFVPDYRQYFLEKGFSLYCGSLQKHIFKFDHPIITKPYRKEECFVGLDGKSIFGTNQYRNTPWCPAQFYHQESRLFQEMLADIRQMNAKGVNDFFSDHEVDFFQMCFCPVCRKDYAAFSGLDYARIQTMTPRELVGLNPERFYCFRSWQSGQMCAELKKALGKNTKIRIGLNSAVIYLDHREGNLGWGHSLFADDPRLTDEMIDFHNLDSLSGGIMDAVQLNSMLAEVKKPVIARTYSNYCFGFQFAHCSTRYEQAKAAGKKMGYDQRPAMQYLSMLNLAATGANGLELLIQNGSFDASIANSIARGIEVIADYENVWRYGKRVENELKVYQLPQKKSPYYSDGSTISGRIWANFFLHRFGPLMYRAHDYQNELTLSVFNWDAAQSQKLVIVPPLRYSGCFVFDANRKISYRTRTGSSLWNLPDLEHGFALEIPPLEAAIITFAKKYPVRFRAERTKISTDQIPEGTEPYQLYHYRKQGEFSESLRRVWERIRQQ